MNAVGNHFVFHGVRVNGLRKFSYTFTQQARVVNFFIIHNPTKWPQRNPTEWWRVMLSWQRCREDG